MVTDRERELSRQFWARRGQGPHGLGQQGPCIVGLLERMDRVDVSPAVLRRAADPFPTPLGTLDAIHLATAVLWREGRSVAPVLVTHDAQLATAARATGFATAGV
jgi:predicted nucleic acid-binding protein